MKPLLVATSLLLIFAQPAEAQLFPRLWKNQPQQCTGPNCNSVQYSAPVQYQPRSNVSYSLPTTAALEVGDPGGTVYFESSPVSSSLMFPGSSYAAPISNSAVVYRRPVLQLFGRRPILRLFKRFRARRQRRLSLF